MVLCAGGQPFSHADTMDKRSDVQFPQLEGLCEEQKCHGAVGLAGQAQIALVVEVL